MANPVAIYNYEPGVRPRGMPGSGQVIDVEFSRAGTRTRGNASNRVHEAETQNFSSSEGERLERLRRSGAYTPRFGKSNGSEEFFAETGGRKAPSSLSFSAQQIAQEKLSPGLHFENYPPVIAAYTAAARHGDPLAARGQALAISA